MTTTRKIATFDLETDGLLDEVSRVWCICIKDHASGDVDSYSVDDIARGLCKLASYDVLIGHNSIAFDFPVLRKLYGWEYNGTKCDTLLISRTQRPNRQSPKGCTAGPHSVEAWGIRLGIPKIPNDVWTKYSEIILERCKQDVEIQCRLYHALLKEGHGEGWANAHRLNNKVFDLLQRQEENGWLIDKDKLERSITLLGRWINRIDRAISPRLPNILEIKETKTGGEYNFVRKPFLKNGDYNSHVIRYFDGSPSVVGGVFSRVGFRKVDLDSSKEVKEYLLAQGWEPTEWNTNDAGDITSPKFSKNDTFTGITSGLGRLIAKRIQCRQRLGVIEGWRNAIRTDGRLSSRVAGIASTGRLRHAGIVNVPSPHSKAFFARQMRELFISRPGWVMVGVDSKGNQMRQLAARLGDDEFTNDVLFGNSEEGTDLHSVNQRRSGAPSRSQAKNFFYGFIFGAGPAKIAKTIKITLPKAKELIETYLKELPALRTLITVLTEEWRQTAQKWFDKETRRWVFRNGYIKGLDGRPILVDSEHKVLCFALQSDEAIQMARAYVLVHEKAKEKGWGREDFQTLIWYHDEIQFECRSEIAEELGQLASTAIKEAGEYYNIACPHDGDYRIGLNWYMTH